MTPHLQLAFFLNLILELKKKTTTAINCFYFAREGQVVYTYKYNNCLLPLTIEFFKERAAADHFYRFRQRNFLLVPKLNMNVMVNH